MFNPKFSFGGGTEKPPHLQKEFREKLILWRQGVFPQTDGRFGKTFLANKAKYEQQFNNGVVIQYGQDKGKLFDENLENNENSSQNSDMGVGGMLGGNSKYIVLAGLLLIAFLIFRKK